MIGFFYPTSGNTVILQRDGVDWQSSSLLVLSVLKLTFRWSVRAAMKIKKERLLSRQLEKHSSRRKRRDSKHNEKEGKIKNWKEWVVRLVRILSTLQVAIIIIVHEIVSFKILHFTSLRSVLPHFELFYFVNLTQLFVYLQVIKGFVLVLLYTPDRFTYALRKTIRGKVEGVIM